MYNITTRRAERWSWRRWERLCVCATGTGCHAPAAFSRLARRLNAEFLVETSAVLEQAKKQLEDYFACRRKAFDIPLRLVGTDFQQQVWEALLGIPYGETVSYKDIALSVGNPEGVRAVAQAVGANGIAIFIPCHRVVGINHSLTGFAGLLCSGIEATSILTELCVKEEELCLPSIAAGDLVVVSMPVYAGRVPALAVERLNAVESNGATCVIVAVYGNRAYEDALVEMQDVATAQGFNVVAAVAANAEHSICRMYGAGRPDAADARELASFGRAILERVQGGKPFGRLALPGNRPYKQGCSGPFPEANQDCTECGVCASQCPTGAISADNPKDNNNQLCIGCMRCVSVCPSHARGIGESLKVLAARLEPLCRDRKKNELFLC